jgi:radical SAM superfamily enzyme YgiQ (UPF0313 family)
LNVILVELQPTYPNLGTYLRCPTYGVALLATILRECGHSVVALVEGVSRFTEEDALDADVVCLSVKTASANKSYQLADAARQRGTTVIMGGTHPTYFPESCLEHSDYVVRAEADEALPKLLDSIAGNGDVADIPGVSYSTDGGVVHVPTGPVPARLDTVPDYTLVKDFVRPGWRGLFHLHPTVVPVQSSRGCRQNCAYCVTKTMFGGCYRKRPLDRVVEEVRRACEISRLILFVDNDFVGRCDDDREHTLELCRRLETDVPTFKGTAFVTVHVAQHPELLQQMYSAGIRTLCVGLESLHAQSLERYGKCQTPPVMREAIHALKEQGFRVNASFMVGANGENAASVRHMVEVAIRWGIDSVFLFALCPYPNMQDLVPTNRIILGNWDHASGHFLYFLPLKCRPSELQRAILTATRRFYGTSRILGKVAKLRVREALSLLAHQFARRPLERTERAYVSRLEEIERGLYRDGALCEQELSRRIIQRVGGWGDMGGSRTADQ